MSRWKEKGGIEDIKKARHFLDILIDIEENLLKQEKSDDKY